MSPKKLTILFTPLEGWGHINACHGLAQELVSRGHRVVFAIVKSFEGKLSPYGFEEYVLRGVKTDAVAESGVNEFADFMETNRQYLLDAPIVAVKHFMLPAVHMFLANNKDREASYEHCIQTVRPDLIVTDNYVCMPSITNAGIPWVWLFSAAIHAALNDPRIPPAWSEFEYKILEPMANNWIRAENFIRTTNEKFEIPDQLVSSADIDSKLIFLSMGSFGCANIELMTRLTTILAKSRHRFIVSKGPVFADHPLPSNMWGKEFLPQMAILPVVDLVISHGGTTVTESYYCGKPALVLPLFYYSATSP